MKTTRFEPTVQLDFKSLILFYKKYNSYQSGQITGALYQSGQITGTLYQSGQITGALYQSGQITGALYQSGQITGTLYQSGHLLTPNYYKLFIISSYTTLHHQ